MSEETVTFNINVDASQAVANISELNRLLTTYIALARRSGLPENLIEALAQIQQLRVAIESLYRSLIMLQTASGLKEQRLHVTFTRWLGYGLGAT